MKFDLEIETQKASTSLALCLLDAEPLSIVYDEYHPHYSLADENDPDSVVVNYDILYTLVHHVQKHDDIYGPYAEIVLAADKTSLSVLLNEFQPWGNGHEEAVCVGKYPISELTAAVELACNYMNTGFELRSIVENENTGHYGYKIHELPEVS